MIAIEYTNINKTDNRLSASLTGNTCNNHIWQWKKSCSWLRRDKNVTVLNLLMGSQLSFLYIWIFNGKTWLKLVFIQPLCHRVQTNLGQTQKCDGAKPVDGNPTLLSLYLDLQRKKRGWNLCLFSLCVTEYRLT